LFNFARLLKGGKVKSSHGKAIILGICISSNSHPSMQLYVFHRTNNQHWPRCHKSLNWKNI